MTGEPVGDAVYLAVQRFLYREARLLDDHRYDAWFELLAADMRYRITVPSILDATAGSARIDIISEDRAALATRIRQLGDPRLTHADNPRTIMRRSITNIEVCYAGTPDKLLVSSYLLAYRGARPGNPSAGFFSAARSDILSVRESDFLICERTVDLDHPVLEGGIVSAIL
jgi:3-phenylpropionate/cinnamic acid dioxygenase small subunit